MNPKILDLGIERIFQEIAALLRNNPKLAERTFLFIERNQEMKKKSLTLRIDERVHWKLKMLSSFYDKTMVEIIEELVKTKFEETGLPKK